MQRKGKPHLALLSRLLMSNADDSNSLLNHFTFLLLDALKRSLAVSHQIGIVAVIVDAKDEVAVDFYTDYHYHLMLNNSY